MITNITLLVFAPEHVRGIDLRLLLLFHMSVLLLFVRRHRICDFHLFAEQRLFVVRVKDFTLHLLNSLRQEQHNRTDPVLPQVRALLLVHDGATPFQFTRVRRREQNRPPAQISHV